MSAQKFVRMPFNFLCRTAQLHTYCNLQITNGFPVLYGTRKYSVFPPTYVPPVYHPDQMKRLDPETTRELMHQKILPPQSNQSASHFHDVLLEKLVNHVMRHGRKLTARRIINDTFLKIKSTQVRKFHLAKTPEEQEKIATNPLQIFHQALQNCKPILDTTPVKRGGVTYKVPIHISDRRATSLAFKWLVETANAPVHRHPWSGDHFAERFAKELIDASNNTGTTIKKKLELHRLCEANKAYAHYRWTK